MTRSGATNGTFGEPSRAREQRVHRDLDPRREHAARELARRRDDVEVRRRPEVDDDARRAVQLARGDGVRDPVRPDLARVVVADRDAGRDARPEDEQLDLRPPLRERLVLRDELRHRRAEHHPVERRRGRRAPRSVTASSSAVCARIRADAVVLDEPVAVVEPEDRLRVAGVYREQHRGEALLVFGAERLADLLGERPRP